MEKSETLEDFYKRKFEWMPEGIRNEIGHFNVFEHQHIEPGKTRPLLYKRRDYYKVMVVKGNITMNYADKSININKQALFFSNPQIPYSCNNIENIIEGYYCIFDRGFFHNFGELKHYSVFQPTGDKVFELTDEQYEAIKPTFLKMFDEINSEYVHKYDAIRNKVFEVFHFAMKMQPANSIEKNKKNASQRISGLFLELLERQFPFDENHPNINLRTASDFALQLNVHVNHLNKAVKETTSKTTSQLIAERILQESKIMLKQSNWNISEIAFALGFKEVPHFNNFFKKHIEISPSKYRML